MHTQAHQEFIELLEKKLEQFLLDIKCSAGRFYQLIAKELARSSIEFREDINELLMMIHDASDFVSWAERMQSIARIRS